jgi:hypothetical protein
MPREYAWDSMVVGTSAKTPLISYKRISLDLVRLQARLSHCKVSIILVTAPCEGVILEMKIIWNNQSEKSRIFIKQ